MLDTVLQTKLHIPTSTHSYIVRPRITAALDESLGRKLALISAPAGFGKTTAVSHWIRTNMIPAAWVTLDEGDNDPFRFFLYLALALQSVTPNLGLEAQLALLSGQPPPLKAVLGSLVNTLDSHPDPLAVVLDDYHRVNAEPVHDAIAFLLEYMPEHVTLYVTTRIDPPLPLARLRAGGLLTEIRAADLRFSAAESGLFLKRAMQLELSPGQVMALDSRTEGWIAGLQMAALSMKGSDDIGGFIQAFSGSHRYILDYLTEEVLQKQPENVRRFLLQTAVLRRLTGPLCDALTGETGGQKALERLEDANLFLLPQDENRQWYRFHQLFADLLLQRLRQDFPDKITGLHRRAADWYEANGWIADAIEHAQEAGDLANAARMMQDHGIAYLRQGDISTVLGWIGRIPELILCSYPRLNLWFAWALMLSGQSHAVDVHLARVEDRADSPGRDQALQGHIAAVRAYAASQRGEAETALAEAQRALALLDSDETTVRAVMSFVLGGVRYMRADLENAKVNMKEAARLGELSGNLSLAVSALSAIANIHSLQGRPVAAEATFERALKLSIGKGGRPLPIAATVYSGMARLYLGKNDLENARSAAETAIRLGEKWVNADSQLYGHLTLARVSANERNLLAARRELSKAKQIAETHNLTPNVPGDIREVERIVEESAVQAGLAEPLTERELEVLERIAAGLTNREIAADLIIALGTVKAHTASIYGKLEVGSRTQAVARARKIGLL